jgi:hypothetical protein
MCEKTLKATDRGNDYGKNDRFNKTTGYVFHFNTILCTINVCGRINSEQHNTGEVTANESDEVKECRQKGKADD